MYYTLRLTSTKCALIEIHSTPDHLSTKLTVRDYKIIPLPILQPFNQPLWSSTVVPFRRPSGKVEVCALKDYSTRFAVWRIGSNKTAKMRALSPAAIPWREIRDSLSYLCRRFRVFGLNWSPGRWRKSFLSREIFHGGMFEKIFVFLLSLLLLYLRILLLLLSLHIMRNSKFI